MPFDSVITNDQVDQIMSEHAKIWTDLPLDLHREVSGRLNLIELAQASRTSKAFLSLFQDRFGRAARHALDAGQEAYGESLLASLGHFLQKCGDCHERPAPGGERRRYYRMGPGGGCRDLGVEYNDDGWVVPDNYRPLPPPLTGQRSCAEFMHKSSWSGGWLVLQSLTCALHCEGGTRLGFRIRTPTDCLCCPHGMTVTCARKDCVKAVGAIAAAWYSNFVNDDLLAFIDGELPMPPVMKGDSLSRRIRIDPKSLERLSKSQFELDCVISAVVVLSRACHVRDFALQAGPIRIELCDRARRIPYRKEGFTPPEGFTVCRHRRTEAGPTSAVPSAGNGARVGDVSGASEPVGSQAEPRVEATRAIPSGGNGARVEATSAVPSGGDGAGVGARQVDWVGGEEDLSGRRHGGSLIFEMLHSAPGTSNIPTASQAVGLETEAGVEAASQPVGSQAGSGVEATSAIPSVGDGAQGGEVQCEGLGGGNDLSGRRHGGFTALNMLCNAAGTSNVPAARCDGLGGGQDLSGRRHGGFTALNMLRNAAGTSNVPAARCDGLGGGNDLSGRRHGGFTALNTSQRNAPGMSHIPTASQAVGSHARSAVEATSQTVGSQPESGVKAASAIPPVGNGAGVGDVQCDGVGEGEDLSGRRHGGSLVFDMLRGAPGAREASRASEPGWLGIFQLWICRLWTLGWCCGGRSVT